MQQKIDSAKDTTNDHILYDTCKICLQKTAKDLTILMELLQLHEQFLSIVNKGKELRKKLNAIPEVDTDFQKIRRDIQQLKNLQGLENTLISIDTKIMRLPTVPDIDADFDIVREDIQKLLKLQVNQDALNTINTQIISLARVNFNDAINSAQEEWTTVLTALKICPVCKQSTVNIGNHCKQL